MKKIPSWVAAQEVERDFWDGMIRDDQSILRVLADNAAKAPQVRSCFAGTPQACLEVGVGPIGLGISGFLPEIPRRFALDPLPPVPLEPRADAPTRSSEDLRMYIRHQRAQLHYLVGCGEEIPVRSESMDLVICCNAIDHASDPRAILGEVHRVLKPNGAFFFDVDTFSLLGMVKWHAWTSYAHKDEILVKAHPYRMYEPDLVRMLQSCRFKLQKLGGHTLTSNWIGHARNSTFVGSKCLP